MNKYPPSWEDNTDQEFINYVTGFCCEHCGMEFGTDRKSIHARNNIDKPCILTVHHLIESQKWNVDFTNLVSVCQACHLQIQGNWKPGGDITGALMRNCKWTKNGVPYWMWVRRLPYGAIQEKLL